MLLLLVFIFFKFICVYSFSIFFFFSSRRRHTRLVSDWSSDVCSSDLGILSGTLARLQGYKSDQRRRVLNDALLFATARKHGCSVLTRNVVDFDFLQQLDPSGKVLLDRKSVV